jgi:hypothetical protein
MPLEVISHVTKQDKALKDTIFLIDFTAQGQEV